MCLCVSLCVCDPLYFHVVCKHVSVTPSTSMLYVGMCLCVPLCLCHPLHFHVVCLRVCACVSICLRTSNFIRMVYRHGGEGVLSEAWVPAKVISSANIWSGKNRGKIWKRVFTEPTASAHVLWHECVGCELGAANGQSGVWGESERGQRWTIRKQASTLLGLKVGHEDIREAIQGFVVVDSLY